MTTSTATAKFRAKGRTNTISAFALAATLGVLAGPALGATPPAGATSGAPAGTASAPLPGRPLDRVVAVVNDEPILESALEARVAQTRDQLESQGTPLPPAKSFRHQVLERLITQTLMLESARQHGIQVSSDQINAALSNIAKRHGLTLAELPKALAAQGQNYAAYRRRIKDQLLIHQVIQQSVAANVQVSSAEVNDYLKREANAVGGNIEYKLAQILIEFPGNATPADVKKAKQKAESIESRLEAGANFASIAAANSAGPHALDGGVIGWIQAANLPTLVANAVPKMKTGDITDPIAGPGGYHIVKLLAKRSPQGDQNTQYHVRHILLKPNPVRNLAQSKALAEKLRAEITAGKTSFAQAAKTYSNDPNSAGDGGDLGWKTPNDLPPAFVSTVESLPINQLSKPVKSHYGWDIMEVLGKRKGHASKEEHEQRAYQAIFQRKLQSQIAQFQRVMRGQAYVHILASADAGAEGTSNGAAAAFPSG